MAEPFDLLLATMRDELAALDGGDAAAIEAATVAKVAALEGARVAGATVSVTRLHEARAFNALAATRVTMLIAGVDRRLAALTAADGRGGDFCYGRDGRTSLTR